MGDALKSLFGVAVRATTRATSFMGKEVLTMYYQCFETLLYVLLSTVKDFTGKHPYIIAVLPVWYPLKLARPKVKVKVS